MDSWRKKGEENEIKTEILKWVAKKVSTMEKRKERNCHKRSQVIQGFCLNF